MYQNNDTFSEINNVPIAQLDRVPDYESGG